MKFSCVTMNSQNQQSPSPPPQYKHNCPSLVPTIVLYPSQVTLKNFQPKVGNRYINFLIDTHLWQQSFLFLYISSFYFFCCVPILCWKSWSFLLVVEHHSVMCHPFHHFIKEICILVYWAILWSFSWAKYFFVWRENGVGTHFEQQFFSFTQHQVPSISTV